MTVQELFNSLTFDEIMNALRKTHRYDRSILNMAPYKEAYDIICNLLPEGDGGEVTFDVSPREEWFARHSLPLVANNVEGDFWENTIQKIVVRPHVNPFTDAELAGTILWGMTFYGFTPRDKWPPDEEPYSHYGVEAKLLEQKKLVPYLRDKKLKKQLKKGEMTDGIAFSLEIWTEISLREKRQNRSKRIRYNRIVKRIDLLEKLDKRQHLIDRLHEIIGHKAIPAVEILNADSVHEKWFDSYSYGKLPRLDYLIDLLENYSLYFSEICQSLDYHIIVCYTADISPLTDVEKNRLTSFLSNHFSSGSNWQLFFASDNNIPNEMALQLIGIKH